MAKYTLGISKVEELSGISRRTITRWYDNTTFKLNDIPEFRPQLPKRIKKNNRWYWKEEDIPKLLEFKEWINNEGWGWLSELVMIENKGIEAYTKKVNPEPKEFPEDYIKEKMIKYCKRDALIYLRKIIKQELKRRHKLEGCKKK